MNIIKTIDLESSVYDLIKNHPELKEVIASLGFKDILKPMMLQTVGKIMTLKKGSLMKNISYQDVKDKLRILGYKIKEKENE